MINRDDAIEALRILKALPYDLSLCDKILEQIRIVSQIPFMIWKVNQGLSVIRGRINKSNKSFNDISDISYLPLSKNYQRANIPNYSMFYGSCILEPPVEKEANLERIILTNEISKLLYDDTIIKGKENFTFGKWVSHETTNYLVVFHPNTYLGLTAISTQFNENYKSLFSKEEYFFVKEIHNYLASEFSRNSTKEFEYLKTAFFSAHILYEKQADIDGILYPSVKTFGKGFNIAIKPKSIDSKFNFKLATECSLYKYRKTLLMDNKRRSQSSPFVWEEESKYSLNLSDEQIFEKLFIKQNNPTSNL